MSCPTCDHTLSGIGHGMFHCPRCGTLVNNPVEGACHVPALIRRCREFRRHMSADMDSLLIRRWTIIGIEDSVALPAERDSA